MSRVLRIRLSGGDAELGAVPAADVAKLLLGVEGAVARGVAEVIGQRVKPAGRWGSVIESAVHFRLVGVERGSVVTVLELPDIEPAADTLDLDVTTLGQMGLAAALRTARGDAEDADIAAAFLKLVDRVGVGSRYESITFETDITGMAEPVRLDASARVRLERVATKAPPEIRPDTLVGVVVEADFEKLTARLRAPDGRSVAVNFEYELADDIQEALRSQAKLRGEIEYDPEEAKAVAVDLVAITRAEQMAMGLDAGEFWVDIDVREFAERDVAPVSNAAELADGALSDSEADDFLAALGA